jgi:hypothetical protein
MSSDPVEEAFGVGKGHDRDENPHADFGLEISLTWHLGSLPTDPISAVDPTPAEKTGSIPRTKYLALVRTSLLSLPVPSGHFGVIFSFAGQSVAQAPLPTNFARLRMTTDRLES